MLSVIQSHPVGVNWSQWAAIAGPILTLLGSLGRWLKKRLDEQDAKKYTFEQKVDQQHLELGSKVDVANMRINKLGERVARLEGPVQQTARTARKVEEAVSSES